jgi:hypothetical protein
LAIEAGGGRLFSGSYDDFSIAWVGDWKRREPCAKARTRMVRSAARVVATPLAGDHWQVIGWFRRARSASRVLGGLNSAPTYVYYTTDRTTPTTKSTLYTGPITVTKTEVIEVIGVASGYANSAVTIQDYRVQ